MQWIPFCDKATLQCDMNVTVNVTRNRHVSVWFSYVW